MANYEATKYDFDGANLTGIEGTATGTILPWSTSSVPTGFLECDGAAVSRSTYATLFGVIAATYGAGDGSSTFNLPNLANNVPVGKSPNKALASTGGADTVAASGNVGGSTANASLTEAQLASHDHTLAYRIVANSPHPNHNTNIESSLQNPGTQDPGTSNAGSGTGHSHNMSATFSGSATSVLQPYLALIYIIKT